MTATVFETSLHADQPPGAWPPPLRALWWDAKGDWSRAHDIVAEREDDVIDAWVHAYLHRREGDAFNAEYWYERAGKPVSTLPLDAERATIAAAMLARVGAAA